MPRGSRKHVLDWTSQPDFVPELLKLVEPVDCRVTPASIWQPRGHDSPREARLESFGPKAYPDHPAWPALTRWWLKHARGANTPNWDIALSCDVEGRAGLILVEAKANVPELGRAGKSLDKNPSAHSTANHAHIGVAIDEARTALAERLPEIAIERDKHYQLSNRLAFAWKLASLGIPTVLLYLGFLDDTGMRAPFTDAAHWDAVFAEHLEAVCPPSVMDGPVDVGPASFWVLARSLPRLSVSGPAA